MCVSRLASNSPSVTFRTPARRHVLRPKIQQHQMAEAEARNLVLSSDPKSCLRECTVCNRVLQLGGKPQQRSRSAATKLIRQRPECRGSNTSADISCVANEDIGIYRIGRNLEQAEVVERFSIDMLPAQITDFG